VLAAGRCLSADSTAYASARVTPVAMALGQAAGLVAAMELREQPVDAERILAAASDPRWR